jgi:ABC-type cobalamin/Fe3+-siderophores transport system ATPase subunit
MTAILEADCLSAGYGGRRVLNEVSVSIAPGRILALLGENGAGKSTLLKTFARIVRPSAGAVRYAGLDVADLSRKELARVFAYVAQTAELAFPISAMDLVLQGRAPWRRGWLWESGEDRRIAERAMEACDVEGLANRDATELSGGERRRVFLARAITQQAPVWLLDEPTADLDPRHRSEFLGLLTRVVREQSAVAIWATHDVSDALAVADDALLVAGGRVVASGPVATSLTSATLAAAYGIAAEVEEDGRGGRRVFFPIGPGPVEAGRRIR